MRSRGFTLIEILVVIVIIAVMLSLAVLSIDVGGNDTPLDQESRRIVGLVNLLHDRALLEGHDFGLLIEPSAYRFLIYDDRLNAWQPYDADRQFRPRRLPEGLSFRLELDGHLVVLKAPDSRFASDAAPPAPQIAIAASGEGTPFHLTLVRDSTGATRIIRGDALGRTKIVKAPAAASAS
ncbi:MAG TPA: type II secretion system minor pseudopilin GspH [Steroidobacteraceae bacterium]|nr:type II secretion system minor pseudopilin GspH [Steroidobacteraceae bacterium]